ncbi:MAG: flap endonuclease-1 [Nanobdellota archaeon]
MGVALTEIMEGEKIEIQSLNGKIALFDAYNMLYQFLTVLRGPDGTPLKNSEGKITSHLQGLFSRNLYFLQNGMKPVYIFDGKPPELKKKERQARKEAKEEAKKKYEIAKQRNDFENMRKYSSRMVRIDKEILESSKKLLDKMGIPYIDAESEAEAQAAWMLKHGYADYMVSQDADALVFGAPNVIRNLSIGKKRKVKGKLKNNNIEPMKYRLDKTLNKLGIDYEQFIILAILIGTDFNIGGIPGIGPKKAIKKIKEYGKDFEKLFSDLEWEKNFEFSWKEVFDIFEKCPVKKDFKINFTDFNFKEVKSYLVDEYQFSKEKTNSQLEKLKKELNPEQKGLQSFFS